MLGQGQFLLMLGMIAADPLPMPSVSNFWIESRPLSCAFHYTQGKDSIQFRVMRADSKAAIVTYLGGTKKSRGDLTYTLGSERFTLTDTGTDQMSVSVIDEAFIDAFAGADSLRITSASGAVDFKIKLEGQEDAMDATQVCLDRPYTASQK